MPRTGRAPQQGLKPRNCVVCDEEFQPYRDFHVACGKRLCRTAARNKNPLRTQRTLTCKGCGQEFTTLWSGIGKQPQCPTCTEVAARVRQDRKNFARAVSTAADPVARREINLRSNLRQYGITPDDYRALVQRQGNRCAVCRAQPDPHGIKAAARLHVDHDHATGANRELLCVRCNQGVGYFRDDPALLRAMAEYIERHRAAVGSAP